VGLPVHAVATAAFVTRPDGRVLLVRERKRGWEMPGGMVDAGESLTSALVREVLEETGCVVEPRALVGIYSRVDANPELIHLFACDWVAGEPRPSDETPEVGWFAADEARRRVAHPRPPTGSPTRSPAGASCS
jgi:8-oxo-dGTP pyrophosphatase MutT (NUDIX family)